MTDTSQVAGVEGSVTSVLFGGIDWPHLWAWWDLLGTGRSQVAWQVVGTCREKAGAQAVGSQGHAGLRELGRSEGGACEGESALLSGQECSQCSV